MSDKTEWTSISVTEEQKETLENEKPDGMAMGAFVVDAIDSNNSGVDSLIDELHDAIDDEILDANSPEVKAHETERVLNRLGDLERKLDQIQSAQGNTVSEALELAEYNGPVTLEATEYSKIADEVEERLR